MAANRLSESDFLASLTILAHRGLWHTPPEKNGAVSLTRALADGFGLETDVRDSAGELVIAHDPPTNVAVTFVDLISLHTRLESAAPVAINIKADGLCGRLKSLLAARPHLDYFCFDMSVPETLVYRRHGLRFFTRESEYEPQPPLYDDAAGVWMDMFRDDWIEPAHISRHLTAGKQVALVSPELHGRPHLAFWTSLRAAGLGIASDLMLCTDHPVAARDFFHD